jgi:MFS family permease
VRSLLISLISLISSSFFVQLSNAAITTMVAIVFAEKGGTQTDVAVIASAYSLGFIVGCFLAPPQIFRVGLIRGYAAAAGMMTIVIVALEMLDGTVAWILLRFLMGASFAAVMAISDTWLNEKAPDDQRGRIMAVYSVVLGLASIVSQLFFIILDAGDEGFVLTFAISMNFAVVLVAVGTSKQPKFRGQAPKYFRPLSFVSLPATVAAFASGFCTASLISIIPFYLTDHGVEENLVAFTVGAIYLGRLSCQWPIGQLSDRADRRTILLALSVIAASICLLAAIIGDGEGRAIGGDRGAIIQLLSYLLCFGLGGALYPMYSVASALAFDRADGRPKMDIATTMLVVQSVGAIVGPVSIMLLVPLVGDYAMHTAIMIACVATATASAAGKVTRPPSENPTPSVAAVPEHSLEMAEVAAELVDEAHEEESIKPGGI